MLILSASTAQPDYVALAMVLVLFAVVAVSGQIASVITGGIILNIAAKLMGGYVYAFSE